MDCLTEEKLDQIKNKNERENHPLNCAKLNAKPYPYFDGGLMKMSQGEKQRGAKRRAGNATITVVMRLHEDSMRSEATSIKNILN